MTPAFQHNIGAFIVPITSIFPQSSAAAVINGSSLQRSAHGLPLSAVLHQHIGAIGGAPSAASVVSKIQHSPDNATWADYTPDGASAVATTAALTAATTGNRLNVDLSGANDFIRIVTTITFTGGTSPTVIVAAELIIGGESLLPAA